MGHRSQYSIERLLSFRDYHQRTSIARVICVCVLTPIPALLTAFSLDCILLKPPSDGWQANCTVSGFDYFSPSFSQLWASPSH
ncbi:hypothetical protein JG688_00014710 [Phytophthora aleatoria]|uniref:Uncharacterized protein n=1 Tax=Phytophthora aleatoria TaxID=2496075 RepID=A0A8J5LXD5_9STRA|nr:hypothetical protein JG688_00014710 [Phytophthora aleatoria]